MTDSTLTQYGLWAFIAIVLLRETLPLLVKVVFPARAEEKRQEFEQRAAAYAEERTHRRNMEERSIRATEEIAKANQSTRLIMESMRVLLDTINSRLNALEDDTAWLSESIALLVDREGLDRPTRPIRRRPPYAPLPPKGQDSVSPAPGD